MNGDTEADEDGHLYPTGWIQKLKRPLPSKYIERAADIAPGTWVMVVGRWSRPDESLDRLNVQLEETEAACSHLVIQDTCVANKGRAADSTSPETYLPKIVERAKACGAKYIVLRDWTRLFKSRTNYDSHPMEREWRAVLKLLNGVKVATVADPNLTVAECEAGAKQYGIAASKKPNGRPKRAKVEAPPAGYKKQRRAEQMANVLELSRAGKSLNDIQRQTGIPRSTVSRWLTK